MWAKGPPWALSTLSHRVRAPSLIMCSSPQGSPATCNNSSFSQPFPRGSQSLSNLPDESASLTLQPTQAETCVCLSQARILVERQKRVKSDSPQPLPGTLKPDPNAKGHPTQKGIKMRVPATKGALEP